MLTFAHLGLTLGAATLGAGAVGLGAAPEGKARGWPERWLDRLASAIDIRVLLVGSLLPDIIDKPLGMVFMAGTFSSGRIFAHTLLFLALLSAGGWYLYRRRHRTWLLVLAFGTFCHFVLDQMWLSPHTLLWPAFGWAFSRTDISEWLGQIFHSMVAYPPTYIPEWIGLAVLLWVAWVILRRRRARRFLLHGKIA